MPIEVIHPPDKKFVDKLWGKEEWIVNNQRYCGKILYLNPGFRCSKHYHSIKSETFYVLEGVVFIEVAGEAITLHQGDSIELLPFTSHRFQAVNGTAKVVEFSSPHREEDVTRLEDSGPIA